MATLEESLPFRSSFVGVGLDSGERGNPPSKFSAVYARARALGLLPVAHAGEEGPAAYICEALDDLQVVRIDHGVRCMDDDALVSRLVSSQVPLTVCPLSNVALRVVPSMAAHPLAEMLRRGLLVTVSSDDPAYFDGYVADNLIAVADALALSDDEVLELCRNSFRASFLPDAEKQLLIDEL